MLKKIQQGKSWGQAMQEVKASMNACNNAVTNCTIFGGSSVHFY